MMARVIVYCRNCARAMPVDDDELQQGVRRVCLGCGQINWRGEDEEADVAEAPFRLTVSDRRFLLSAGILAD